VLNQIDPVNFFDLFGVFFPAVTGVLAGASRSAELKEPQRDIPRGTLAAQISTSVMCKSHAFVVLAL
jgi:potassium/chloride transporter 4/5/6